MTSHDCLRKLQLDKITICSNIKKARTQDLILIKSHLSEKNSIRYALTEIRKILNKANYDIIMIRR
jgi:adenylate kinase